VQQLKAGRQPPDFFGETKWF